MKTAICLLLISTLAWADPPADAPLAEGRSIPVAAGELAPFAGQLIEPSEMVRRERINERNAAELAKLKADKGAAIVSAPVLVAIVLGTLAVGVGLGMAAGYAAARR
jgi:hypothetical protein